jgi:hypothetical protein
VALRRAFAENDAEAVESAFHGMLCAIPPPFLRDGESFCRALFMLAMCMSGQHFTADGPASEGGCGIRLKTSTGYRYVIEVHSHGGAKGPESPRNAGLTVGTGKLSSDSADLSGPEQPLDGSGGGVNTFRKAVIAVYGSGDVRAEFEMAGNLQL